VRVSRRAARGLSLLAWIAGVPLAHGVVPWLLSRVGPRWAPSALGLIPLALGALLLTWVMIGHVRALAALPDEVSLDWKPKVLLATGPYAFSRNPMYVGELALWLGWALLFGSAVVLAAALLLFASMTRLIRSEETALAAEFGADYRAYQDAVPRWLGAPRRHARG
jgi:protein-S-isoprenylcysteine O-methyltransferase Ste14